MGVDQRHIEELSLENDRLRRVLAERELAHAGALDVAHARQIARDLDMIMAREGSNPVLRAAAAMLETSCHMAGDLCARQEITPADRADQGLEGSIDIALERVRKAYLAFADPAKAPSIAGSGWRVVLLRLEGGGLAETRPPGADRPYQGEDPAEDRPAEQEV